MWEYYWMNTSSATHITSIFSMVSVFYHDCSIIRTINSHTEKTRLFLVVTTLWNVCIWNCKQTLTTLYNLVQLVTSLYNLVIFVLMHVCEYHPYIGIHYCSSLITFDPITHPSLVSLSQVWRFMVYHDQCSLIQCISILRLVIVHSLWNLSLLHTSTADYGDWGTSNVPQLLKVVCGHLYWCCSAMIIVWWGGMGMNWSHDFQEPESHVTESVYILCAQ